VAEGRESVCARRGSGGVLVGLRKEGERGKGLEGRKRWRLLGWDWKGGGGGYCECFQTLAELADAFLLLDQNCRHIL
jgi:hypothetical protein